MGNQKHNVDIPILPHVTKNYLDQRQHLHVINNIV